MAKLVSETNPPFAERAAGAGATWPPAPRVTGRWLPAGHHSTSRDPLGASLADLLALSCCADARNRASAGGGMPN